MMSPPWSYICDVDVAPLAEWLDATGDAYFPEPSAPAKPQRIHVPPLELIDPIVAKVLTEFCVKVVADPPMLSRMLPGQTHGMHVDVLRADCLTRVHVPITTNPGCWMEFEEANGYHVHFFAGKAYTFDARRRHAFGNAGETARTHLIFDVLRG